MAAPNMRRGDTIPLGRRTLRVVAVRDDSRCVPTFHQNRQTPATATRQLDFVFASPALADAVSVRAMNTVDEWSPSDHCRVLIDVAV